jgi:hypothetical protein
LKERQLLLFGYVLLSPLKLLVDCLVFLSYSTLFYGMADRAFARPNQFAMDFFAEGSVTERDCLLFCDHG